MKKLLIAGIALLVLVAVWFALMLGGFFEEPVKTDKEQIVEITHALAESYNDEDWPAFPSHMFTIESNDSLVERFSGYQRFSAIKTPPEIIDLEIDGDYAELSLQVESRGPISAFTRRGQILFEKRGGKWWIDADNSFSGFPSP